MKCVKQIKIPHGQISWQGASVRVVDLTEGGALVLTAFSHKTIDRGNWWGADLKSKTAFHTLKIGGIA